MLRRYFFRVIGAIVFAIAGYELSIFMEIENLWWIVSLSLGSTGLGFLATPYLTVHPARWARKRIKQASASVLIAGIVGLLIALAISALLAIPLSMLPGLFGRVLPIAAVLFLSYLGISVMVSREGELLPILVSYFRGRGKSGSTKVPRNGQVILDTSAIIDGRIADISQTGFIKGPLLVPTFVLDELQHIADSPDSVRRNRGRRGLDILSKLQKESDVPVQISEADIKDVQEVDAKLVKLAKTLSCPIITNDLNLNRVADLQGVEVLNINKLASAVRSVILPGEELRVRIIQEGKEAGQGVAFLDDGTMIVVEGGRRHLNTDLDIVVTRALQTTAGRMIFAHPKKE